MKYPRRVPWVDVEEFSAVFNSIFNSSDLNDNLFGVNRIKAWDHRGSCPHAIESTGALKEILIRDLNHQRSSNELRLMYSMAITRFVNGLVDPLQQFAFARSIGSLASSINLPQNFVSLRHAATHEDLPSLISLRSAAIQALSWLRERYWITSLSVNDIPPSKVDHESLDKVLGNYKRFRKDTFKDRSTTHKEEISNSIREVEQWVESVNPIEYGVECVAERLWKKGGFISNSMSNRSTSPNALPQVLKHIWYPLIVALDSKFDGFIREIVIQGVDNLTNNKVNDKSYEFTSISWINSLLEYENDDDFDFDISRSCLINSNHSTKNLLDVLIDKRLELKESIQPLMNVLNTSDDLNLRDNTNKYPNNISNKGYENALDEMERRLAIMESRMNTPTDHEPTTNDESMEMDDQINSWSKVNNDWTPCAIGSLPNGIPTLTM